MANFQLALTQVIVEMSELPENYNGFCTAIYWDSSFDENALVMFMDYDTYGSVHAVMKEFYIRLSEKLGHPVSLCHNHPTDECVLVHGSVSDSEVYYSDEC